MHSTLHDHTIESETYGSYYNINAWSLVSCDMSKCAHVNNSVLYRVPSVDTSASANKRQSLNVTWSVHMHSVSQSG